MQERYRQKRIEPLIALLLEIKKKVETAQRKNQPGLSERQKTIYFALYDRLTQQGLRANPPPNTGSRRPGQRRRLKQSPAHNLLLRRKEHKATVLAFMIDFKVPFDNNQSERDLRMMKVKQKVSGCFRSEAGADIFPRLARIDKWLSPLSRAILTCPLLSHQSLRGYETSVYKKLKRAIAFVLLMMTSACGPAAPAPFPLVSTPTTVPITETFTALPATPTAVPTFTPVPLNLNPQIIILAENLPEPDDLVLAPDGSVYISDVTEGTVKQYTSDGQLNRILSGLRSPEGMVFLPDGSMVIAEQSANRLIRYDLNSKTLTPFLDLPNRTNQLGVDGILWDGANLIVPDSPNGTVLEVSPDGQTVRQIASGLMRPTGAWLKSNGDLLIADENGDAIYRLHADGTLDKVADFSVPDDVVEDVAGNIFVVTLGDDAIHLLTAGTHQDIVLVSGFNEPQGIIFDTEGNLIVTDSGNHRLLKVLIH